VNLQKVDLKKHDKIKLFCILFLMTLLYAINKVDFLKYFSQVLSIALTLTTIYIGIKKKINMDRHFFVFAIYLLYNLIVLCLGFSKNAIYMVFQELALLTYSFFVIKISISEKTVEKIANIFSTFYYVVLSITAILYIIGLEKIITDNITQTIWKALFALSFFAYITAKRKWLFSIISFVFFFFVGERTTVFCLVLIYIMDNVLRGIKSKKIFDLVYIITIIILLTFVFAYVTLPSTKLGIELNRFVKNVSNENLFSGRNVLWQTILDALDGKELQGLTYDNDLELSYYSQKGLSTHNLYLWLMLNGGLVLLLLFLIYMFEIWRKYFDNLKMDVARISAAYFIGFMTLLNFELLLLNNNYVISLFLWYVISMGVRLEENTIPETEKINQSSEKEIDTESITDSNKIIEGEVTMSEEQKRCIYHVPNYIDPAANSGSTRRPKFMLQAFKDLGYNVDVVMGYAKERKEQIKKIKQNIKKGVKYEFLYSECSTVPTLLTEKHHLPLHPFLDFGFMKYCKKNKIKIGLYYRDIYWKFPFYGTGLNPLKKKFAIWMYEYDIKQYRKIIDILYLQTMEMAKYLPNTIGETIIKTLPPGGEYNEEKIKVRNEHYSNKTDNNINIFYVGGIGVLYDLEPLLKVVNEKEYLSLTVCCREKDWEEEKTRYEKYLNDRIKIIHKSGKDLQEYYERADLCSLYFPDDEYRRFVLPIKLFEYIEYGTPIIATKGTETGKFLSENNIGWEIPCKSQELSKLLNKLHNNRKLIVEKHNNVVSILKKHTWLERAKQVEKELTGE